LLKDLPVQMRKLEVLRELRLSGNNFSEVPEAIFTRGQDAGMTNLRLLALDHNPLRSVHDDLATCAKMERLLLHNTQISKLHRTIAHMRMLKELWISDTRIRTLDVAVSRLPSITKVVVDR